MNFRIYFLTLGLAWLQAVAASQQHYMITYHGGYKQAESPRSVDAGPTGQEQQEQQQAESENAVDGARTDSSSPIVPAKEGLERLASTWKKLKEVFSESDFSTTKNGAKTSSSTSTRGAEKRHKKLPNKVESENPSSSAAGESNASSPSQDLNSAADANGFSKRGLRVEDSGYGSSSGWGPSRSGGQGRHGGRRRRYPSSSRRRYSGLGGRRRRYGGGRYPSRDRGVSRRHGLFGSRSDRYRYERDPIEPADLVSDSTGYGSSGYADHYHDERDRYGGPGLRSDRYQSRSMYVEEEPTPPSKRRSSSSPDYMEEETGTGRGGRVDPLLRRKGPLSRKHKRRPSKRPLDQPVRRSDDGSQARADALLAPFNRHVSERLSSKTIKSAKQFGFRG